MEKNINVNKFASRRVDTELFEIARELYKQFGFLELDLNVYKRDVRKIISYSKQNANGNSISKYFEELLMNYFYDKCSNILKNENEDKDFLVKYIIYNFKVTNSYTVAKEYLFKFSSFLNACKYNFNLDVSLFLLNNNSIIYNLVDIYFKKNKNEILSSEVGFEEDNILDFLINGYCILNNIVLDEISDNLDNFEMDLMVDNSLKLYLEEISEFPLLSFEEEKFYAEKAKNGDFDAKKVLIQSNLRLVYYIIKKYYSNCSLDILDLIQEGNVGLMRAVDKYDYTLNRKFSSYASYWIRHYINRAIAEKSRNIRIPVFMVDRVIKYQKAYNNLSNKLLREPNTFEIAQEMNLSIENVEIIKKFLFDTVSYYDTENDDNDCEFLDILSDNVKLEDIFIDSQLKYEIDNVLNNSFLTDKEKRILILRNGFVDNKVYTLQEIADFYHVSRENIRQIELKAIRKILSSDSIDRLLEYSLNKDAAKLRIKQVKNKSIIKKFQ